MFLSQKSVNKNLYTCVHAKKKKSSRRTNYGKDYKKPASVSLPVKKKNETVKKLKKKNLW